MAKKTKTTNIISVDMDELQLLVQQGKEIFVTFDAEKSILKLLKIQEQVDAAVEYVKQKIAEAGEAYNPNFTSIKGDALRISYRQFGGKYVIDETRVQELPQDLYKTRVSYSADAKAVDKWAEENGGLPLGISERERAKKISITIKK